MVGDRPTNLGVADLTVAPDGTVWLAREGALSLTSFTPANHAFFERPLPSDAGDPAKLALGPDGHIFFTTDLSADHQEYIAEKIGEFDPSSGIAQMRAQGSSALAINKQGDLYATSLSGTQGSGLLRLRAAERANARAQQRTAVFDRGVLTFGIDDTALAIDTHGRIWTSMAGKPRLAVFDPATGQTRQFQYAAPSKAAHPARPMTERQASPAPDAVWLSHIVAMTTDADGHLWYIRSGSNRVEEVSA